MITIYDSFTAIPDDFLDTVAFEVLDDTLKMTWVYENCLGMGLVVNFYVYSDSDTDPKLVSVDDQQYIISRCVNIISQHYIVFALKDGKQETFPIPLPETGKEYPNSS